MPEAIERKHIEDVTLNKDRHAFGNARQQWGKQAFGNVRQQRETPC